MSNPERSLVESSTRECAAGWWSSDASHYFHAVTYHLDLVAALQSRGLSVAAAEALLESRPLFCFTAEAISNRDTDVWLQVSDRMVLAMTSVTL
jgi:hypothetical protein